MVDTLSRRRTHYEVLGLTPAATSEEIEQAFARQFGCFQPHTVGRLADFTVAYEALRNPARRRAYDVSLGIEPEAPPRQPPMKWRIGGQVMTATAVMRPAVERPVAEPVQAEPQVEPEPAPSSPEVTPFIAASPLAATLRELASPEPLRERLEAQARPQPEPPRQSEAEPPGAPRIHEERRVNLALNEPQGDADEGRIPWKRAGIVVGAVTAAVALLGAWAGWDSVGSAEPAENATKAALPPPTTYTVNDPAGAAAANRVLDVAPPTASRQRAHAATRTARVRPTSRPTSRVADLESGLAQPQPAAPEAATAAIAPADPPPTVAASLPLSNRVIARTIARIGYPCGQVASTSQGTAPGAFKVTCTSGHSYQAAPVRGRYHFRRLAGG